ncbi:MAG: dTMP kinase [Calditrichaeota bacterium]|nr:dTMP kinase [Calditrichota bacterium]
MLIAIEGIDGAGKTTQIELLKNYYTKQNIRVAVFKEPSDSPYGKKIKELAINGRYKVSPKEEFLLFLNDRIYDCEKNIKPALNKKMLVFMDRYYFSSIAYQSARGLDKKMILKENEKIAVRPDLVIILDVAVKIGLSRIRHLRNESINLFEQEEYLEKVREIFLSMKASYVQIVDASRKKEEVFENLKNIINDIINPYLTHTQSKATEKTKTIENESEELIFESVES